MQDRIVIGNMRTAVDRLRRVSTQAERHFARGFSEGRRQGYREGLVTARSVVAGQDVVEVDESGLVVRHEIDPDAKAQIRMLRETIAGRKGAIKGVVIAGVLGLGIGLLLALVVYWLSRRRGR